MKIRKSKRIDTDVSNEKDDKILSLLTQLLKAQGKTCDDKEVKSVEETVETYVTKTSTKKRKDRNVEDVKKLKNKAIKKMKQKESTVDAQDL